MDNLTLRKICNTDFPKLYKRFLLDEDLSSKEYERILSIAILFINTEILYIQRLGYRIIVIYGNRTGDYSPLYEIAINKGLYPIAKFIDSKYLSGERETFFTELNSAFLEIFKERQDKQVYFSEQQYRLNSFYNSNSEKSVSVVAPTSYGKTELILQTLQNAKNKKICIITPTKSLLMQTRKRVLNAKINWIKKVVIFPEMYKENDKECVAILTQERLLRLLKENPQLKFDYVIIDEAHNLLNSNQRDELLASAIIVLNKRNKNAAFKFLTPFVFDSDNFHIRYAQYNLTPFMIDECIKSEKIFVYDIRKDKGLSLYDQYMNDWYEIDSESKSQTCIQFIRKHSSEKNIIYFNKPKDIENFAIEMIEDMPDVILSEELSRAIEHISEYVNPEYTLVKCLKKGIVYHHGSIPDFVRNYIEHLYSKCSEIKYIITSSTLLEGVNIPATRMFLLDNRKGRSNLSVANFKNLLGRVCRFSEIFNFNSGSLEYLEPEIYIIFDKYCDKRANIYKYVSSVMKVDKSTSDRLENVLLKNTKLNDKNTEKFNNVKEFLENYEQGTITDFNGRYVHTNVGRSCVLNNIYEVDIYNCEKEIENKILKINNKIDNIETLLNVICDVFLPYIRSSNDNNNLLRLHYESTKRYYKMFLSWLIDNIPFNRLISYTVSYWKSLVYNHKDTIVFVGKWGDTNRGHGYAELWTDIKDKKNTELINLAIVRLKEEQDFIDNVIMKYVEVINDLGMIEPKLYFGIKYGTDNSTQISLIKNGIGLFLARLLIEKYSNYIQIDVNNDTVYFNEELIAMMSKNNENSMLIYEAQTNVY